LLTPVDCIHMKNVYVDEMGDENQWIIFTAGFFTSRLNCLVLK